MLDPSQHQPLLDVSHVTLHHRHPVVVIATGRHCISHHLDGGLSLDGCPQIGQSPEIAVIPETEMAAKGGLLLDEDHRCSRLGCCNGRSHPCGTATGHQDVGVCVAVVVFSRMMLGVDHSTSGESAQNSLVPGPQAAGCHEGLVIEARGEEA